MPERGCQRLRRDDEIVERHDLARHARLEPAQVAVAGQHHVVGGNGTVRRPDAGRARPVVVQHPALFVYVHPQPVRRGRQPQGIVQGVQVRGGVFHEPGAEDARAGQAGQFLALDELHVEPVIASHEIRVLPVPFGVTAFPGRLQAAALQVTLDAEAVDEFANGGHGLQAQRPQSPRFLPTNQLLEFVLRLSLADGALPAVAPRGAPAGALRLQQRHAVAALGQVDGRGKARIAATDHADIGPRVTLQLREAQVAVPGRTVVGLVVDGFPRTHAYTPLPDGVAPYTGNPGDRPGATADP